MSKAWLSLWAVFKVGCAYKKCIYKKQKQKLLSSEDVMRPKESERVSFLCSGYNRHVI